MANTIVAYTDPAQNPRTQAAFRITINFLSFIA